MIFNLFGKKKAVVAQPNIDAILAEIDARTGVATRAKELPAWALLLRSPYKTYGDATSWLGGVPHVPAGFDWPTGNDGRPLHFIAQIDLATLKLEPSTGVSAPSLPADGALLVFIGDGYAVRILSPHDLAQAAPAIAPPTLSDLSEQGFWGQGATFTRWPVDPIAYMSRGEDRPDFLPDPFATPQQWITTWGLATFEASAAHDALALELRLGREFMAYRQSQQALGKSLPSMTHITARIAHCEMMEERAPQVLAALQAWQSAAAAEAAEAAVDVAALNAIFDERTRLSAAMKNNYGARPVLAGDAHFVWEKILAATPGPQGSPDFSAVAPAFRAFVAAKVTDWRGHRFFGLEPEFPNNGEDLRHQSPLISIAADALLGTQSEHDYGFSVWLKDEDLARGRHADGQFIRHCAV